MKNFGGVIIVLSMLSLPVHAVGSGVVTLDKSGIEKPEITIQTTEKQLQGSLLINNSEALAQMIELQKEKDCLI